MPSLLRAVLAGFGTLLLISGLVAISAQAWLAGLILLFFGVVLLYVGFALYVAPNFRSLYTRTSRVQMQQYRMHRAGSFSGYGNFQSPGTLNSYQNQFQNQGVVGQRSGFGIGASGMQNRRKSAWIILIIGVLFLVFGYAIGAWISFIYGLILTYSGIRLLGNPGASLNYRQARMNMAPIVPAASQDDGLG